MVRTGARHGSIRSVHRASCSSGRRLARGRRPPDCAAIEVAEVPLDGELGGAPVVQGVAQVAVEGAGDRSEELGGVESVEVGRDITRMEERCMRSVETGR